MEIIPEAVKEREMKRRKEVNKLTEDFLIAHRNWSRAHARLRPEAVMDSKNHIKRKDA